MIVPVHPRVPSGRLRLAAMEDFDADVAAQALRSFDPTGRWNDAEGLEDGEPPATTGPEDVTVIHVRGAGLIDDAAAMAPRTVRPC